jgi:hypothetical protein
MLLPADGNVGSKSDAAGQEARAAVAQAVKPAEPRFVSALAHLIFHASFQLPGDDFNLVPALGRDAEELASGAHVVFSHQE